MMGPTSSISSSGLLAAAVFAAGSTGTKVGPRDALPSGYVAAPYYPAPYTGWVANWTDSVQKAKALVDTMTLAEKANITAGTGIFMGKSFPSHICGDENELTLSRVSNVEYTHDEQPETKS